MKGDPAVPGAELLFSAKVMSKKLGRRKPTIQELIDLAEFLGRAAHSPGIASFGQSSEETVKAITSSVVRHLDQMIESKLQVWFQPPSDLSHSNGSAHQSHAKGGLSKDLKDEIRKLAEKGMPIIRIGEKLKIDNRRVAGYIRTSINAGRLSVPGLQVRKPRK